MPDASPSNAPLPHDTADGAIVDFIKGRHQWRFRCGAGEQEVLIGAITTLASDPHTPIDWFDAATISHQISGRPIHDPLGQAPPPEP